MTEPSPLPGDPTELHLRFVYADMLSDTPHADTLEEWRVEVLHRRRTHDNSRCPTAPGECEADHCPAHTLSDSAVGSMTFFRVHLDRGRNAYAALADESEDLNEIAQVLLDPVTGYFTDEVSELLEYSGSALLVMDRVTLREEWRGQGLGTVLASEAIFRLMPGCRAVACAPGVTDLGSRSLKNRAEWDRVNTKISHGWKSIGFRLYRDNIYLLSPVSEDVEEQRGALRGRLVELAVSWRTAVS
ncbi:hypothetical protein ACGFW5_01350 [Streptomyces sp. NPDC048416]|uniref:hypothetical protein n=1 Tax=Streptomyces sp. NPDC048416 TaxID=3365546 RepID=UPI00371C317E